MAEGNDFYLKSGDTDPGIRVRLEHMDPDTETMVPTDLTGATVKFRMSVIGEGNQLIFEDADVIDEVGGIVEYLWPVDGTQTTEIGDAKAEWVVTFPGGRKRTYPR